MPPCAAVEGAAQFREAAKAALGARDRFVLINFSRETMSDDGQGGGHFSPLAAYDEETDSFLVMDVARYKYPPFWVDADLLGGPWLRPTRSRSDTAATSSSTRRRRP